uniref:Uncharacterized protein n=1 Tax=Panagrolaimus sp. PS1159 TaxID=55785 RepID=A0AC35GBL8_9BILA
MASHVFIKIFLRYITDPDHHYDVYHESDSESLQIEHSPRLPSDRFIEFEEDSPANPSPEDNVTHRTEDDEEVHDNHSDDEDEHQQQQQNVEAIEKAFIEVPMTGQPQQPQIILSDDDEMEIGSPPPTERDDKGLYYGYEQAIHEMGESGKVSDLISRFNQGGDKGSSTKQEYGSGRQIGKIQQTKFR